MAADMGTCIHSFCEEALLSGKDAYDYIGEVRTHNEASVEMDEDLADKVQSGLDYIDQIKGKLVVETRLDLQRWLGRGQFGTLDVGIAGEKEIVIFDWKWGYIPVSPIRNYQLMLYALGFYYQVARFKTHATRFRLVIWQPNAPGGGGEWIVNLSDLEKFGRWAKTRADKTRDPNAPRIPGKIQCAYCPGAKQGLCPDYDEFHLAMIVDDFERLDEDEAAGIPIKLPSIKGITPERRSYIIQNKPSITKWLERLEANEKDDFLKGLPTPGRKGVEGRTPARQWTDKEAATKRLEPLLGDDAFAKRVITPKQAEEELTPAIYEKIKNEGLVKMGERQVIMVDEDDARPPVSTIIDMFED